jgi:hypothetical protein
MQRALDDRYERFAHLTGRIVQSGHLFLFDEVCRKWDVEPIQPILARDVEMVSCLLEMIVPCRRILPLLSACGAPGRIWRSGVAHLGKLVIGTTSMTPQTLSPDVPSF